MPALRLQDLVKRYGKTMAVDRINLVIQDGEMVTLLGPSGCGKTTTLRCIAGFATPDAGEIYLDDARLTVLPPNKRDIGIVFQNYALWPHMTVFDNLAFGLRLRKVPRREVQDRVEEALALVRLGGLGERYPPQLSGGQQQRVALARALIIRPRVLLLDEPLSNLDAQLREEMRFEIRELQRKLAITAVYVTHDQAEALALSDRVAVMNQGVIAQMGTPEEIYDRPRNRFVAGFIGLSSFVEGVVTRVDGPWATVATGDGVELRVPGRRVAPQERVTLAIRPEHIRLGGGESPSGDAVNHLEGQVERAAYLGDVIDYRVRVGRWSLRMHAGTGERLRPGDGVRLTIPARHVTLIPAD